MCGKFTGLASWRNVVDFSQPLTRSAGEGDGGGDEVVTYRVNTMLPVIVWDAEARAAGRADASILADEDWATWLGETAATPTEVKAVLKTMEGVNWQAAPEPKAPRRR